MNLVRKMMRHGSVVVAPGVATRRTRDRAIKKGTPYRRLVRSWCGAVHATKGREHSSAVLDYRMKLILDRAGANPFSGAA